MKKNGGYFVISLDFELFWGMFDKTTLSDYGARIRGEQTAIPQILELFTTYDIHATWATVGMLMAKNRTDLLSLLPPEHLRPRYKNTSVSAYEHIKTQVLSGDAKNDIYYFAPLLLKLIQETDHQEIGNHTFSHYYCIDGSENQPAIFKADLAAFAQAAKQYGITPISIVFPRNQWNADALHIAAECGLRAYRGNEDHFLYRARGEKAQSLVIRGLRLLDHYINISGHHTYPLPKNGTKKIINVPSSRFLRPWHSALRFLEPLRLRRIKNAMTHAAKNGEIFHLWWHPHNFGINQEENLKNLEEILTHYANLKKEYAFKSASMRDIVTVVDELNA